MTEHKALPRIGSEIDLPRYGTCIVEPSGDPSLVALRTPRGGIVKVGDKALRDLLLEAQHDRGRPAA